MSYDIPSRVERSYLEPPYEPPQEVECAFCGGSLLEDQAYWYDDKPYCSSRCRVSDMEMD